MGSLKNYFVSNPKKAMFLIVIIVAAFAVSVYAYIASLAPVEGPKATITSPPLEFSIQLDRAEYMLGENMTITFCLRNISNKTITITEPAMFPIDPSYGVLFTEAEGVTIPEGEHLLSRLFHFGFCITDNNGTEIHKEFGGIFQMIYNIVFEFDGYVKQTLVWNYDYDHDLALPTGTYQFRGILYRFGVEGLGSITLETPSITFTYK